MREDSQDRMWGKGRTGPQTTKVFTPSISPAQSLLKLNKQYSVPVINHVAAENQHLTRQREILSSEMGKVATLGQYLAKENERMRAHYHQRTCDVSHLMKTMQINTYQNISELQHQIHLLKQSNCLIYKNIQQKSQQLKNAQNIMKQLSDNVNEIQTQNVLNENEKINPMKAKLANKLNSNHIYDLEKQRDQLLLKENILLQEVQNLLLQTNKLKKYNIENSQRIRNGNIRNKTQKQTFRGDIVHVLKTLSQLKEEKQGLKVTAERQKQLSYELERKRQETQNKLRNLTDRKEANSRRLQQLQFQRQRQIQKIKQALKSGSQKQIEVMKITEEKEKLEKEVQKRKEKQKENKQKFKEIAQRVEREKEEKIKEIKKKILLVEQNQIVELRNLKEQALVNEGKIQVLRESHRTYASDINDYHSLLDKLQNPVNEIERAQMILRLQGKRQGLRSLSGF